MTPAQIEALVEIITDLATAVTKDTVARSLDSWSDKTWQAQQDAQAKLRELFPETK